VNPVLVNDLRKSLFRRKPVLAVALMAAAILVLTYGVFALIPMGASLSYGYPVWRFPDFLLPVIAPAFAAGAFAREHEQRTWQDVLLTRLRASEILAGKFFACFLPTLMTLVILFPPFAMLLIVLGVEWAYDPGPWMFVLGAKFLLSVAFYVSAGLVCSYHSPNPRVALVVTYAALAAYGMLNHLFWLLVGQFLLPETPYHYYRERGSFELAPVDGLILIQMAILCAGMLTYLGLRVRWRKE
jgi:ABC-type transport system involved in multi-copper enzyme maturation permease subunit